MEVEYTIENGNLIIKFRLFGSDEQGRYLEDEDEISIPCLDIAVAAGLVD